MDDETAVPDEGATAVVPDATRTAAAELAWSSDTAIPDEVVEQRRPLPRSLKLLLAVVGLSALALGGFVLGHDQRPAPPPPQPAASEAPPTPPPRSLLNGTYRIEKDWDHHTYRGNKMDNGGTMHWEESFITKTTWWTFRTVCGDSGFLAVAVNLSEDRRTVLAPTAIDVLRLTNGLWVDMTPYHELNTCTRVSDGTEIAEARQVFS